MYYTSAFGLTLAVQVETVIAATAAVGISVAAFALCTFIPPPVGLRGLTVSVYYSTEEKSFFISSLCVNLISDLECVSTYPGCMEGQRRGHKSKDMNRMLGR